MSFCVGTLEAAGIVSTSILSAWQAPLAALVGTYGLIKQHEVMRSQLALSERSIAMGEQYLGISQGNYTTITLPTYSALRAQYDRYVTAFSGSEDQFVDEAFRLIEFEPDYSTAEGRATSSVQSNIDKAAQQRRRSLGQYATGRAYNDSVVFAVQAALARVDAANTSFRMEEERKRYWDKFYWGKWVGGASIVQNAANTSVSALSQGANAARSGLQALGGAFAQLNDDFDRKMGALANQADAWGSMSNGAFKAAGQAAGMNNSGGMAASGASTEMTPGANLGGPCSFPY